MAGDEFVKEIKDKLRKQQESNDLATKTTLHNAHIIETEGRRNWDKISEFVQRKIAEINHGFPSAPLTFASSGEAAFQASNRAGHKGLTARLEATTGSIAYDGSSSGIFRATVVGNELTYTLQQSTPSPGISNREHIELQQVAETLILILAT